MFRNNRIVENAGVGLLFRQESEAMGAHRNVFEKNVFLDNGTALKDEKMRGVVVILGWHHELVFRGNTFGLSRPGTALDGIVQSKQARDLRSEDNEFRNVRKNVRVSD